MYKQNHFVYSLLYTIVNIWDFTAHYFIYLFNFICNLKVSELP